ncbi:hypothetical protein BJ170DRAFT_212111 [Xylariales sp. AK1849]|nr:hypothetical protein BJ170DRAFT_212111 [Xylariales sp. AK1849]
MIYNESYPPHRGHLGLLEHAFEDCGEDFNVLAAIIVVTSDERLHRKFKKQPGTVKFSRQEQAQLRREGLGWTSWCCMYDCDHVGWTMFLRIFRQFIMRDRFEIEFVGLGDPDYINPKRHDGRKVIMIIS